MPLREIGVLSVVLTALRRGRHLTRQELADLLGVSRSLVKHYETTAEPAVELLVEWGGQMGYTPDEVESAVAGMRRALRGAPAAGRSPVDPAPHDLHLIRSIAGRAGRALTDLLETSLDNVARTLLVRRARRAAGRRWRELQRTPPELRRAAVETFRRFQTWAVAERLAHESAIAASDQADRALELAELGLRAAELCAGDAAFRAGAQGYARLFVANVRRVANQFDRAEADFARGLVEWDDASPVIRSLLPAWRVKDLEGSLRRDQRRFPESLASLQEAQILAPAQEIPRILVKRAVVLEHMFEPEQAVRVLEDAERLTPKNALPQRLRIYFNLAQNLCHLEKFHDAERLLPRIQELADAGRQVLVLVRCVWLRARCNAGLGRAVEARAGFTQVRAHFMAQSMAADYALASLEQAVLDLEAGRTAEVRQLATEMNWIFRSQGLQAEALAALTLFRDAAAREAATADLARRVVRYLHRAQYDPSLRFEAEEPERPGRQSSAGREGQATIHS